MSWYFVFAFLPGEIFQVEKIRRSRLLGLVRKGSGCELWLWLVGRYDRSD